MKLLVAAIACAVIACGGPEKTPPDHGGGGGSGTIGNTADPSTTQPHEVMATLERTACFGSCPMYKVTVYRDGVVAYDGEMFVKQKGAHTGQITANEVADLDRAFGDAHYFDLADKYTNYEMTDMPSANTSYAQGGRTKSIEHYYGDSKAPEALSQLEDKIDTIIHIEQFIGTQAEREANNYYR
jgi:hypothetical protein